MSQRHPNHGVVYLVGAGPGDPGLITVRGMQLLEQADVVVFDYLANPQLLRHCPTAETIYVGKQAAKHAMSQDDINKLLVEKGLEGKKVVRLKGGDPFVFGRGGEECEALAHAGVRFEVVPGITSAIAAPAYAGIPVTHRDLNSSFTLITGHEKEADYQDPDARARQPGSASDVDWSVLAKLPCLAFYMGVKALPGICQKLLDHGMAPDMPAASIQWGTTTRHRAIIGTLSDLPQKVAAAHLTPPAITLIGRVVSLRQTLNWFETRPLFGQTIVVTRTRQQASDLAQRLDELGAHVIEAPTIELEPPHDPAPVNESLRAAAQFDWIVFTSQNGVSFTRQRLMELGLDVRAFGPAKIAAIGDATAAAIRDQLCLKVDLCPPSFVAEALAAELLTQNQVQGKRFLLLRADIARPILRQKLQENGAAEVRDVAIYQTKIAPSLPPTLLEALSEKHVHWITFTSSSTAKNFVTLLGKDYARQLQGVKIASIGPVTTATLKDLSLPITVQAEAFNIDGLIDAIVTAVQAGAA
ncbi:MAG: uroporphyrinogen-III C-methyltransferase [Bacillota bacterium]